MAGSLKKPKKIQSEPAPFPCAQEKSQWKEISDRYARAADIAVKYGLDKLKLERAMQSFPKFKKVVLLAGPENSGKSALLNALTSSTLYDSSLSSRDFLPSELVYGKSAPAVAADFCRMDTASKIVQTEEIMPVSLYCDCAFLKELSRLRIMKLPQIDDALLSTLRPNRFDAQSYACVLVFSADDPMISAQTVAALFRMRQLNISVQILITKCDKVTPNDLIVAKQYIERQLCSILQKDDIQMGCVQMHPKKDLTAAYECFRRLQEDTETLSYSYFEALLSELCSPALSYLRYRIESGALAERHALWDDMMGRLKAARERFQSCEDRAAAKLMTQKAQLPDQLGKMLSESEGVLETFYLCDPSSVSEVRDLMCMILTSVIVNHYEPIFHDWETALGIVPETQDLLIEKHGRGFPGYAAQTDPAASLIPERVPCARSVLSAALEQFAREGFNFLRLLEECRPRRRMRGVRRSQILQNELIPGLILLLEKCVNSGLQIRERRLRRKSKTILSDQCRFLEQAAHDAQRQNEEETVKARALAAEMERDLFTLTELCRPMQSYKDGAHS